MENSLSSGSDTTDPLFSNSLKLQILAYDSYQSKPSVLDQHYSTIRVSDNEETIASSKLFLQVPILRVFGKLQTGHTVLLNLHNCFPYIFIEYNGDLDLDKASTNLKKLKIEIERQLYLSFKKVKLRNSKQDGENEEDDVPDIFNDYSKDDNDPSNYENKYISSLLLVKSTPFYGYHIGYKPFVKISLLNPRYLSRLSAILLLGKVNGTEYQPYESHIPYLLQFMTDYNLYGCDWMYLDNFLWRAPIICDSPLGEFDEVEFEYSKEEIDIFNQMKVNESLKDFLASTIRPFKEESMIWEVRQGLNITSEEQFPRVGSTILEMDCLPQWILNRKSLSTRDLHHDFIEIANLSLPNSADPTVKYLSSTLGILKDVLHQRTMRNLDQDSFFSKVSLMYDENVRIDSADTNWIEQDELNDMLNHCIDLSKQEYRKRATPTFDDFVQHNPQYENIRTPKEDITRGMFRNIQWQKLILAESSSSILQRESFNTIVSTASEENRVLPSSMFEADIFALSDPEEDPGSGSEEENWMGTVPPHETQNSEGDSLLNDPELDLLEGDLFSKPKIDFPKSKKDTNRLVSFSLGDANSSGLKNELGFTQRSAKSRPLVLSPSVRLNSPKKSDSMFEFIGSTPLPQLDENFLDSFENNGMPKVEYQDPFYSKPADVPPQPFILAGRKFVLMSDHYSALPKVEIDGESPSSKLTLNFTGGKSQKFEFRYLLPSFEEVDTWLHQNRSPSSKSQILKSQIVQTTPNLKHGFKFPSAQNKYKLKKLRFNKLITLSVEVHVNTRGDLKPDPKLDEISAIFWSFDKDNYPFDLNIAESGILLLDSTADGFDYEKKYSNTTQVPIAIFDSELLMVRELVSIVKLIDPDLLAGFEIHAKSWGYIIERFREYYDIDLCSKLSRVVFKGNNKFGDKWGYSHASGIKITGRHMMNLWRIFRGDVNLLRYTIENLVYHILHRRIPHYSEKQLTEWFTSGSPSNISALLNYYISRTKLNLEMLDKLEIISKTTEQARLIGVDFYSIFYRGSQFKVESFLIRLTKSENFMLISPSKQQVFKADALQCIPLIMEPSSAFYKSPLVVLDFQSLYPSIIIAYNYCYSTLLGRLRGYNPKYPQTIGVTKNKLEPGLLELLKDYITISPNGLMFAKSKVRKSILAKMLTEILETRILVKKTMVELKDDYELNKLYNSRQLALKLLANVTYGYTSATFSGRMPCGDIADAIVSTGRETLNQSIRLIESNDKWGAKVVYGDTDSLFVYFPGKSREEAFRIGREVALYITSVNPKPMTLKFEKVYHPCVLLSKKRYVGYSYEYEDQKTPTFDAKGIETVRRDGIPAQQKIVEKSLRILFETCDLSKVKEYVQGQFLKIMNNKVSVQDFCFAKEVRIGTYKDERYAPAGAHVTKRLMEQDKRAEPQYKERVPYVVLQSYKGKILRDRCVTPQYFLENEVKDGLRLDYEYYITKALIPPLERIFNLVGVDVKAWYRDMPRKMKYSPDYDEGRSKKRKLNNNLTAFLKFTNCVCCSERAAPNRKLCESCLKNELSTILKLTYRVQSAENDLRKLMMICRSCSSSGLGQSSMISDSVETAQSCTSDDCPLFYSRLKAEKRFKSMSVKESAVIEQFNEW